MESPPESVEVVDYFAAGTTEKDQGSKPVKDANLEQKVGQVADEHESLPHHLKRLFLYCSLFPSGYEFSKDEFIQLWIAEGFIRERQNQRMEDTASEHFNSLETEGFFVLSRCDFTSVLSAPTGNFLYKVNPIKHSILGDMISSGNYFRAVDGKLDGASEMTRHLSLICEDIDGMTFGILQNFKHLRTLHLLSCRGSSIKHVPRDFCFTLTFLRTLNLSGTLISELPSSIGNVKSLRYIDASHTPISRLPESIDSLHKLQTIKLRGCIHFVQLPKGMKKLSNLRHIDLDIIRQLDSMPAHLGNLSNLQTLPAFLVGRDDGCHVGELKNLNDLRGAFNISRLENVLSKEEAGEAALMDKKGIHSLELRWSNLFVEYAEQQEKVLECLQPHSGLKELQIQQYSGSVLPTWISNPAFADLVVIALYRCRNCKLLQCMGQLPALKSLSIIEVNEVKEINHQFFRNGPVDHAFPKLERLEVDIMLNLKEWKDVQMGDLPSLVKLTVDSCPELVTLPALSCLKSLKQLEFRRCPKLMSLPNDGLPSSLESFLIVDCLELKHWCLKSEHWRMLCHLPSIWFDNEDVKGDVIADVGVNFIKHVSSDVIKHVGSDISNFNLLNQGDLTEHVGGNVSDFIKDVHVHGRKKIGLPRFVVLKAKYDRKCLRLTKNDGALPAGFVKFEAREVVSLQEKFELETAKSGHGLVHIRCCYNNKYLVRFGVQRWIVAAADKPEENKSKISCTLFKLEPVNKSGGLEFRFRHIQLGMYACLWRAQFLFYGGLYGGSNAPDQDDCDVYTVLDWESLVKKMNMLPKFVALKAIYNNKYLSLTKNDPVLPEGFMKFDGVEVASPLAKLEVEMAKSGNGLVHIRCCYNNKYLVREGDNRWIVAAADEPNENKYEISCTLFKPVPYDESGGLEFRFRHVQLEMYACLLRAHIPFYGCLYGGSSEPNQDACDVYTVVELKSLVSDEVDQVPRQCSSSLTRSPSLRIQALEPSSLHLVFSKSLSLPIFTASKISDEDYNPIQILLVDKTTIGGGHQMVPIKVEIVVLDGDFPRGDGDNWTSQEFDNNVLTARAGKRPLLTGDVNVMLRDGFATIVDIEFTDNSSWIRSKKFRLGARVVAPGMGYKGSRIREAMTDVFVVKDRHAGELFKKHHPLMLEDEVWRLKKIGKDGAFHRKLAAKNIHTVQDFLKMLVVDRLKLKRILGNEMSEKGWEVTVKHAKKCMMGNKMYIFRGPHFELFLTPICHVTKAVINGQTLPIGDLDNYNRTYIENLVRQAYANWNSLEVVDTLMNETTLLTQGYVEDEQYHPQAMIGDDHWIIKGSKSSSSQIGDDQKCNVGAGASGYSPILSSSSSRNFKCSDNGQIS